MIEGAANPAAHRISETLGGANALHQTGRKSVAEYLIENLGGIVVGVVAENAQFHHADVALVHVSFRNQIVAGLGGMEFDVGRLCSRAFCPSSEHLAQLGLHGGRVEIADNAQNDVVGINVSVVPVDEV